MSLARLEVYVPAFGNKHCLFSQKAVQEWLNAQYKQTKTTQQETTAECIGFMHSKVLKVEG